MSEPIAGSSWKRRSFLSGGMLALLSGGLPAQQRKETAPALPERGLCAHRGAMDTHPENTLPAFEEAIRLGAHMIEFDVQLSRDGELVLMHDTTVNRTTGGEGKVADLNLKELRALDAGGHRHKRFKGVRIPTLAETLGMMPRNVWLNCHLKGSPAVGAAAARAVIEARRRHQVFLACSMAQAAAARKVSPDILICNMERQEDNDNYVRETIEMKAAFIQLRGKGEVAEKHIRLLRDNSVKINYYEAATTQQLLHLIRAGVHFPLVNRLGAFMPAVRKLGILPWQARF